VDEDSGAALGLPEGVVEIRVKEEPHLPHHGLERPVAVAGRLEEEAEAISVEPQRVLDVRDLDQDLCDPLHRVLARRPPFAACDPSIALTAR
jgi:hypothetical protein